MAQFEAFDQNVEVGGRSVLLLVDVMGHFQRLAVKILAENGLTEMTEDAWYPLQAYLNAYRKIYEQIGEKTLKTIGKQVPGKALWPSKINTIEEALASIDEAYHMNHRGGEIGYYRFEKTGEREGTMTCYNPYPCPFDHGIIEAMGMKFAPAGARVKVTHGSATPCRLKDGDTCTYTISW